MKIGIIGSVTSTARTILGFLKHDFEIVGVLGFEDVKKSNVSGWFDLRGLCEEKQLDFKAFNKINDNCYLDWMRLRKPDIILAVGFSQLLSNEWLELPRIGCVGFHPTKLPRGRGRAPLAWLILEEKEGAANFFLMGEGADDGPLLVQEVFQIEAFDDASSIRLKILEAIDLALDKWLPELKQGTWKPIAQDEYLATWYGKRAPSDGLISWDTLNAKEIDRLIKSSSHPHPGAFSFLDHEKIIIWKSEVEENMKIKGVPGRILISEKERILVQCKTGLIWLTAFEYFGTKKLLPGVRIGYNVELEINKIWKRLNQIN